MGWRTEARESIRRCDWRAEVAKADAEEARAFAAGLPPSADRDAVLRAAEGMEAAAAEFTETSRRVRRTLDRKWSP